MTFQNISISTKYIYLKIRQSTQGQGTIIKQYTVAIHW